MSKLVLIVTCFALVVAQACEGPDEAKVQTVVAEAAQTALKLGEQKVETEVARSKETAVAKIKTEAAKKGLAVWKVGLDPGHGWADTRGAEGSGMLEREVVLDIALRTKQILERDPRFQVVMTRTADDLEHGLAQAAKVMNEAGVSVVVSIHANAGKGTGTEACYTVGKSTDAQSQELAQLLVDAVADKLSLGVRGIFPENTKDRCARTETTGWTQLYIHDMDMPAAVIETAFIDNANDAKLLRDRRQDFAQAIAEAMRVYVQSH